MRACARARARVCVWYVYLAMGARLIMSMLLELLAGSAVQRVITQLIRAKNLTNPQQHDHYTQHFTIYLHLLGFLWSLVQADLTSKLALPCFRVAFQFGTTCLVLQG